MDRIYEEHGNIEWQALHVYDNTVDCHRFRVTDPIAFRDEMHAYRAGETAESFERAYDGNRRDTYELSIDNPLIEVELASVYTFEELAEPHEGSDDRLPYDEDENQVRLLCQKTFSWPTDPSGKGYGNGIRSLDPKFVGIIQKHMLPNSTPCVLTETHNDPDLGVYQWIYVIPKKGAVRCVDTETMVRMLVMSDGWSNARYGSKAHKRYTKRFRKE